MTQALIKYSKLDSDVLQPLGNHGKIWQAMANRAMKKVKAQAKKLKICPFCKKPL